MRSSRFILTAAITAGVVLVPVTALAQQAGGASETLPYLAIAGIIWFAIDKIIDLLPIRENTLVSALRAALNSLLAKKPQ